jgi:hypothetical protein
MAAIHKDDHSNLGARAGAKTKVEGDIARIEKAYAAGLAQLSGTSLAFGSLFGQSEAEENGTKAIRALRPSIDGWIARGRAVVASGKRYTEVYPKSNGWAGWAKAAEEYLAGINAIVDIGDHGTFAAVVETVKEAPATTAKAITKAAVEVQQAGATAALGVLKPLGIALGVYLALRLVLR